MKFIHKVIDHKRKTEVWGKILLLFSFLGYAPFICWKIHVYFSCVYGHILLFVSFCPMVHYWSEYLYYANLLALSCCHLSLHSFSNLHVSQYRWNTTEVYMKHKCTLYIIMGYNLLVTCVRTVVFSGYFVKHPNPNP